MLLEATGIIAMLLILGAYMFLSLGKMKADDKSYQLANLLGALLFIVYLSIKEAWASVALNVVWAIVAAFTLIKIFRKSEAK